VTTDFGFNGTRKVPPPVNEPVKAYAPGSAERAELKARLAAMAKERIDVDGIDPPIPPSGPLCEAELPRRLHIEVPDQNEEVDFRYKEKDLMWNPPLPDGIFEQAVPAGLEVVPVRCD